MEAIKESEISELAVPWASSRLSWLMRDVHARMSQMVVNDVANKSVVPLSVDEVVQVSHKCKVPPFGHKVISRECEPCSTRLPNEHDDSWAGEEVAFTPSGHRCAKRICHVVHRQQ